VLIEIDHTSPLPPYEQLRAAIASMIATHELPEGHRLPSVRQLAGDIGIAPNTVVRAYQELETERLVKVHGRRGVFVLGTASPAGREDTTRAAAAFADHALRRGLDPTEALAEVVRALEHRYHRTIRTS